MRRVGGGIVVVWRVVGVPWLTGWDGRGVCWTVGADRVGEVPSAPCRKLSIITGPFLDAGESDSRLVVLLIIRPQHSFQLILGPFTHTAQAAQATYDGDGEDANNNTNDAASAGV